MGIHELPPLWRKIFANGDRHDEKAVITEWRHIFGERLSLTLAAFEALLHRVALVHHQNQPAMLYTLIDGRRYIGYAPTKSIDAKHMLGHISELLTFYTTLHDGWVERDLDSMGPLPLVDWQKLEEMTWDLPTGVTIPADARIAFSNGAGAYLCLQPDAVNGNGLLWFHDDTPEYDVNFLDVLDEWIAMGLQD